jgi:hypothetical protein
MGLFFERLFFSKALEKNMTNIKIRLILLDPYYYNEDIELLIVIISPEVYFLAILRFSSPVEKKVTKNHRFFRYLYFWWNCNF